MRQIVNGSSCQIWRIADDSTFNGSLAEECDYFSDASLYQDDPSEDEFFDTSLFGDNQDVEVDSNKNSLEVDVPSDMGVTLHKKKGKWATVREFRSIWGTAGQENLKEDSLSSEQVEIMELQMRNDKKMQARNRRAEGCKPGTGISHRKQSSDRNGRVDIVQEGESDLEATYFHDEISLQRENNADFEAGTYVGPLFSSEISPDCHADRIRKDVEYLESEEIRNLCGSSRKGTGPRAEVDRQIAAGRSEHPSDNLLKRKRGRPRKERPQVKAFSHTDDTRDVTFGCHSKSIHRIEDEKYALDKSDYEKVVGHLDTLPKEKLRDAATENFLHKAKKYVKSEGKYSSQRKVKQGISSLDVGAGGIHDKDTMGLVESPIFDISFSRQNSVIYKTRPACRGLADLKSRRDLHVDRFHVPAEDSGVGKDASVKLLPKCEIHLDSKKKEGGKQAMANGIASLIQGAGQTSGSEEAKTLKSRKGRAKQFSKLGSGESKQGNEATFENKAEKEEACTKHKSVFVKVGSSGKTKDGGIRAVKEDDEQQKHKGRYKGKRKLVKGSVTHVGFEEDDEYPLSAMSEARKILNSVQNKRCKVRPEGLNMDNHQRWKSRPVISEKGELPTKKFAGDNTVATELTTSSKKWISGGGQKGQKKPDSLLKEREDILPCEDGNATVGIESAKSTGVLNAHHTTEDLVNDARGRSLVSELVQSDTGVVMQEKQLNTNLPHRAKGTPCKGNVKHRSNAEVDLSQVGPVKKLCASLGSLQSIVEQHAMAAGKDVENGVVAEEVSSCVTEGGDGNKGHSVCEKRDGSDDAERGTLNVGWVLCDDCHKWRCIPAELADVIEATNCRWCCRDNLSKDFADCSIPQEKSNAEINAELNISEVSFCEEGDDNNPPVDSDDRRQAVWALIKHNVFLHRRRKVQTIDEIMVCQCKLSDDGGIGCGDECLNRMLSIECVPETCPCGDFCSNQQFQKRAYARVGWYRCGKKGFGLQVLEDVRKGNFIIEYIGEVLDRPTYEARQKEYACRGQKHFYFMTLNSDEVIDACAKGNLGRFINHSCEPNCVTEKWMVNGEVCIGLFATRDLAKGEEITFDYNYVRVCGAAAKKCHCGSSLCRGFIGGDPTTPLVVVESESDGEDPEPLMIEEPEGQDETHVVDRLVPAEKKHVEERSSAHVSALKQKWIGTDALQNLSKRVKIMASLKKSGVMKGLTIERSGGRFEGVEEKLNELLDDNGGICRRKDAGMHYLKLLVMTAASGDTINGEASRRTRDLSMVLDALLKTLHRSVLADVISKNGLQILHNMMKQNRRNYKRTPIIRKLLKVLEFLASRNILTFEQINSNPPRNGIESIRDTILELSRHSDGEVQQIARRFQEKWFPRKLRQGYRGVATGPISGYAQKNSEKMFLQYQHQSNWSYPRPRMVPDQGIKDRKDESIEEQNLSPTANDDAEKKPRRKSRWDQPFKPGKTDGQVSGVECAGAHMDNLASQFSSKNDQGQSSHANTHYDSSNGYCYAGQHKGAAASSDLPSKHLGAPEGFSLPQPVIQQTLHGGFDSQPASSCQLPAVVSGVPVEQFFGPSPAAIATQQLTICYGIPVSIGKQFSGSQNLGSSVPPCSLQPSLNTDSVQGSTSNRIPAEQQQRKSCVQAVSLGHTAEQQQQKASVQAVSLGHTAESKNVIFGVPHTQFFQQMQSIFGPAFHPWHLRVLMAPHSWGPFFTIQPELMFEESETCLEPEPPVPGLSPPHNFETRGSQLERSGNSDRVEAARQPPEAQSCNLSKLEGSARQQPDVSKWRSSRCEGSAVQPSETSNWRSSRWEGSAGQPTETTNWRSSKWEGPHGSQDGSTEASNGNFPKWDGSNGARPWKFHGRKYNSMYRRDHNFPRRYNRPTQPWRGDFNRFHASNSATHRENFSYKDRMEKVVHTSSHETKWDVMPHSGRCNIGYGGPSSRKDTEDPQVDTLLPKSGIWPVNKLSHNMSNAKDDQLTYMGCAHECDRYWVGEVHGQDINLQLRKDSQDNNSLTSIGQSRETITLSSSDGNFVNDCAESVQPLQGLKSCLLEQCEPQMISLPPCKVSNTNEAQNSQDKEGICIDIEEHCSEDMHQPLNNGVTCLDNWHKEELDRFWSGDLPRETVLPPYANLSGREELSYHATVNINPTVDREHKSLGSSPYPRADCRKHNRKMMDTGRQDPLVVAEGDKGANGKDSLDRLVTDNFAPKYCEEEWVRNSSFADPVAHCMNLSYAEGMDRDTHGEFDVVKDSICGFEISDFDEERIHESVCSVVDTVPQDDVAVIVNDASLSARWVSNKEKTAKNLITVDDASRRDDSYILNVKEETLGLCAYESRHESQVLATCLNYNAWRVSHDDPAREDMDNFLASDEEVPHQMHIDGFGPRAAAVQDN